MKEKGIKFINETFPNDISLKNNDFYVSFKKGSTQKYDLVMEALGRVPNIENLNLKAAKVKTSKNNSIIVNSHLKPLIRKCLQ
jgi:pyruvate/2-oxoglutarate dehydrogenase complex dihydrolipoamide dehydrogenase (E3) component